MVHLVDNYFLKADQYNYILTKNVKYTNRKGEDDEREVVVGYVASLPHAMQLLFKHESRAFIEEHDVELREAMEYFTELQREIVKWGAKHGKSNKKTKGGK